MKLLVVENPRPLTVEHVNDVANAPLSASLNSGYALAVARRFGWDASYLDFTQAADRGADLADRILAEAADLVLFHWVYSWGHEEIVAGLVRTLKENAAAPMGAFGLFPTLSRHRLLEFAGLDFLLIGEFEETLQDLLLTFPASRGGTAIPGLLLGDASFSRRELVRDISSLPFPEDVGVNAALSSLNIAASRGCFGSCSFCFISSFYGCQRRRTRSLASFRDELDARLQRRDRSRVYFTDPTFVGPGPAEKERAVAIGKILKERNLTFGLETRADTVDEPLLNTLAKDGATDIFLGIESGCDAALRRMNKKIDKEEMAGAVRSVQRSGIDLHVGFIMFEADTTLDELAENFLFLDELRLLEDPGRTVNLLYHSQIMLYGSQGWERLEKEGRLLKDERLPFEADFVFRDEKVARVCAAMKSLSTEYFLLSAESYRREGDLGPEKTVGCVSQGSEEVNGVLKESFRRLLRSVGGMSEGEFRRLKKAQVAELRKAWG